MTETYMSKDLIADITRIKNAIKVLDRVRNEHSIYDDLVEDVSDGSRAADADLSYVVSSFRALERQLKSEIIVLVRMLFFDVSGKDGFADIAYYIPKR